MSQTILFDIGLIILFAAILANVTKAIKQPLILGYVLAGILIGHWLHKKKIIRTA